MNTTEIQLEAGKRYVRRDGEISGVIGPSGKLDYPWRCNRYLHTYDDSGRWIDEEDESVNDLVEEYVEASADDTETAVVSEPEAPADDTDEVACRILEPDELVQNGDEVLFDDGWEESGNAGGPQALGLKYRRPLKTEEAEELAAADVEPGGWIDWPGGECPVDENVWVEVRLRGRRSSFGKAGWFVWENDGGPLDIDEYREVPAEHSYALESRVRPVASGEQQPVPVKESLNTDQPAETVNEKTIRRLRQITEDLEAEPEKQPQPDEWWLWQWANKTTHDVMWCAGRHPGGKLIWERATGGLCNGTGGDPIRHLPDCTGFDYEIPPEQTPAENRLEEVGLKYEGEERYSATSGDRTELLIITTEQAEAMIAHKLERSDQ